MFASPFNFAFHYFLREPAPLVAADVPAQSADPLTYGAPPSFNPLDAADAIGRFYTAGVRYPS